MTKNKALKNNHSILDPVPIFSLIAMGDDLFTVSLRLNKDSLRYLRLLPLSFVYLRIHDFIFIKIMIQHVLKRESKWNHIVRARGIE